MDAILEFFIFLGLNRFLWFEVFLYCLTRWAFWRRPADALLAWVMLTVGIAYTVSQGHRSTLEGGSARIWMAYIGLMAGVFAVYGSVAIYRDVNEAIERGQAKKEARRAERKARIELSTGEIDFGDSGHSLLCQQFVEQLPRPAFVIDGDTVPVMSDAAADLLGFELHERKDVRVEEITENDDLLSQNELSSSCRFVEFLHTDGNTVGLNVTTWGFSIATLSESRRCLAVVASEEKEVAT